MKAVWKEIINGLKPKLSEKTKTLLLIIFIIFFFGFCVYSKR